MCAMKGPRSSCASSTPVAAGLHCRNAPQTLDLPIRPGAKTVVGIDNAHSHAIIEPPAADQRRLRVLSRIASLAMPALNMRKYLQHRHAPLLAVPLDPRRPLADAPLRTRQPLCSATRRRIGSAELARPAGGRASKKSNYGSAQ